MQPKAVLLINDEPDFLEAVSAVLAAEGYPVVTAANAVEALEHLQDMQPVLIVAEFRLPDADGFQFLVQLRERGLYEDVPKLILSTEEPAVIEASRRDAAVDAPYLHKLSELPVLLRTVRDAFEVASPRRAGVALDA